MSEKQEGWNVNKIFIKKVRNDRIIIRPIGEFDINDISSIVQVEIVDLEDYH